MSAVRPDLADAEAYRWQEGLPEGVPLRRFDMNTSPAPPAWYGRAPARLARVPVHVYPDATYTGLRAAVAAHAGFDPAGVVLTAGADEALMLCALLALRPGDRAYVRRPFYPWFGQVARLAGARLVHEAPQAARLRFVCSPHNPTGVDAGDGELEDAPGLTVIDQAYVEYGGVDLSHLVGERAGTVVVRTLSKAFCLAGARVGYVLAPPAIAERLEAIRPPASIAAHSVALGQMALADGDGMRAHVAGVRAERARVTGALRAAGYGVTSSHANFVLVDVGEPAAAVAARLLEHGLVVRTFADPLLERSIRITIATPADDEVLLAALGAGTAAAPSETVAGGRAAAVQRRTAETQVDCRVVLDGSGRAAVATGIGMLDHMLTALGAHSLVDLELSCTGDLWVDAHHTVEDVAIVLGQALDRALGERAGIARFGEARAPLDEALAEAVVDLAGRGVATVSLPLDGPVGELPAALVPHFFDTLARNGRLGLHLSATGGDGHHVLEAAFKALARALRQAVAIDPRRDGAVPSTKGSL